MPPKVSLVESTYQDNGVQKSLELIKGDVKNHLSEISSLMIKINFVDARKELATTPFKAVEGFIDFIKTFYEGEVIIAEAAAWGNTKEGFREYGFTKLTEKNSRIKLLDLRDDDTICKTIHYPEGEVTFPLSKTMVEAPFLVSITRPKTHCTVVVTLGIKNVVGRKRIHRGRFIHNIMTSLAGYIYPDLVILDGTVGMEGDGPIRGAEIKAGWTVSSLDALAADSLATYLMGFNVDDVGYLNLLRDEGYGALYPIDQIDVLGERPEGLVSPFKPHRTFGKQRKWRI